MKCIVVNIQQTELELLMANELKSNLEALLDPHSNQGIAG